MRGRAREDVQIGDVRNPDHLSYPKEKPGPRSLIALAVPHRLAGVLAVAATVRS
jgi:hypothetical protein